MKRLHQIVGMTLVMLWVPIASHCILENVPGLQFLQCATNTPEKPDCEGDSCCQFERASYKNSNPQKLIPNLLFLVFGELSVFDGIQKAEEAVAVAASPPETIFGWQFSFRTALPPRAPSFVS